MNPLNYLIVSSIIETPTISVRCDRYRFVLSAVYHSVLVMHSSNRVLHSVTTIKKHLLNYSEYILEILTASGLIL